MPKRSDRDASLQEITNCIQNFMDFEAVLDTVVQHVHRFLDVDRVKIYRFAPDGSGEVIAEAVNSNRLPSLRGLHFPDSDIPTYAREQFGRGHQRVIVDVASKRKALNTPRSLESIKTTEAWSYSEVDSCHVQYLLTMGVISSLAIPLFHHKELWGLMVAHHSDPRHYADPELQAVQLMCDQISVAIAQDKLVKQAQAHIHQEQVLQAIHQRIEAAANLDPDLEANALLENWASVLKHCITALDGCSGRLYLTPYPNQQTAQIYTEGEPQPAIAVEEQAPWRQWLSQLQTQLQTSDNGESESDCIGEDDDAPALKRTPVQFAIAALDDQPQYDSLATAFTDSTVQSVMVVPLCYRSQLLGYLSIFRQPQVVQRVWAGQHDSDSRNTRPRKSFQAWRETTQQIHLWNADQIKLGQRLGNHLCMAVMQQQLEQITRHRASHDVVTQLPNWLLFSQQLELRLLQTLQHGDMLAVAVIDINRFKAINDTFGHTGGNHLLQLVADRLSQQLEDVKAQHQDPTNMPFLARWHGDGFIAMIPHLYSAEDIHAAAQHLLQSFAAPFYLQGQEVRLTASLGLSLAPYDGETAEKLMKYAESALHEAQQNAAQTYRIYMPDMSAQASEQLSLEAELHYAISRNQLFLEYQPQVDLMTGQMIGVEALLRWQHPRFGLITPPEFIPIAEETGLIIPIGEWVLRTACEQYHTWQMAGLPRLHVGINLSPQQFQDPQLVAKVDRILRETNMNPYDLGLEVTENTVIQNVEHAIAILQQLQDLGVKVAIDDFGMGYSSFSLLKQFPLDVLKIDKAFIQDIEQNRSDAAIATAIVALAQGLRLSVVAEGVETQTQLQFLQSIQCNWGQGYFISYPLAADAIVQLALNPLMDLQSAAERLERSELPTASSTFKPWPSFRQSPVSSSPQPGADPVTPAPVPDSSSNVLAENVLAEEQSTTENLTTVRQELAAKILEYEHLKRELLQQQQREQVVLKIAQKIRHSLELDDILNTTVQEVRRLLQTDRVILFQFDTDWSGSVVVESVAADCLPILGEHIEDPCFRDRYVKYYRRGRVRAIDNIHEAGIDPCHLNLLRRYDVMANLVVPIMHQDQLWGLMIAHHCHGERHWKQHEITLLSELATQAAIAIHQGELYKQLKETNRQLEQISSQDGLTRIANRRRFDQYLAEEWHRSTRSKTPLSLILCDVDFFKYYNDTYGHQAGDACLQEVAATLERCARRPADLVARYGGEEFAVVLPHTPIEGAMRVAEEIRVRIRALGLSHSHSTYGCVTLSLGVSCMVVDPNGNRRYQNPNEVIAAADAALYQAKAQGRDRVYAVDQLTAEAN